jgi:hypothetical protein
MRLDYEDINLGVALPKQWMPLTRSTDRWERRFSTCASVGQVDSCHADRPVSGTTQATRPTASCSTKRRCAPVKPWAEHTVLGTVRRHHGSEWHMGPGRWMLPGVHRRLMNFRALQAAYFHRLQRATTSGLMYGWPGLPAMRRMPTASSPPVKTHRTGSYCGRPCRCWVAGRTRRSA